MKKLLPLLLAVVFASFAHAQTSVSGSGGTFSAPQTIGAHISISGVHLSNGSTADVSCPVTFFGAGTYAWNWSCSGGVLFINSQQVSTVSGTVKLTCSGGGRTNPTVCYHVFTGDTPQGPINATAKGGANNAPGTVISFLATY